MNFLNFFKIISVLEGVSYLLLLFVAVPLKYVADFEIGVKILGMPHGVLFIAYLVMGYLIGQDNNWKWQFYGFLFLASITPFGTFVFDKHIVAKNTQPD